MNLLLALTNFQIGIIVFFVVSTIIELIVFIKFYKKCPPDKVMIIIGKMINSTGKSYRIVSNGSAFVIPIFQEHYFLDLNPIKIPINVTNAIDKTNNRINLSLTFTFKISTQANLIDNAVERLIGLSEREIKDIVNDIVLGEMRLYIANCSEEDLKNDYAKTFQDLNKQITPKLNKLGIEIDDIRLGDKTSVIR